MTYKTENWNVPSLHVELAAQVHQNWFGTYSDIALLSSNIFEQEILCGDHMHNMILIDTMVVSVNSRYRSTKHTYGRN